MTLRSFRERLTEPAARTGVAEQLAAAWRQGLADTARRVLAETPTEHLYCVEAAAQQFLEPICM